MAGDEAFHAGKARGRKDFLVGRGGLAEGDVVANLAEKQVGILQHEADAGAQIGRIVLAGIDVIDADLAVRRLVEACQKAADGGLAGTDAADNSDPLAGGDLERDLARAHPRSNWDSGT